MSATDRADALAGALMRAAKGQRPQLWATASAVPPLELGWAIKRCSDAAWSTDPPATAAAAELAEQLAIRQPAAELRALASWLRAIALLAQGRMADALTALEAADRGFVALGRPHEAAQTRISRMMALAMLDRFDDAVRCGAQAQQVFDRVGDTRAAGKVALNLGNLEARRDRHTEAAAHYREAQSRLTAAGDVELQIAATKGLADMLARRHEFDAALTLYRDALRSAASRNLAVLTASIEGDLGAMEMRRGRYDRALVHLQRACSGYEPLGMPHYLAVAEENLASAYLELNLLPEALALYERSLATYEAAGLGTDRAWALSQRGRAQGLLGRPTAALASLAEAEAAFGAAGNASGSALARLWQAEVLLRQRQWSAALHHADAAAATLEATRQLSGCLQARWVQAQALRGKEEPALAEQVGRSTRDAAVALQLPAAERRCNVLLGLLARDRGDTAEARRCFVAAVESIESQRGLLPSEEFRAAFLGENLVAYHELVQLGLQSGRDTAADEALQWIERARARSLADTLEPEPAAEASGEPRQRDRAQLRLRLDDCYREMAHPPPDAEDTARRLDEARALEAKLLELGRRSALADGGSTGRIATLDLAALHAALGRHSALVEYFVSDAALHACVVAGGRVTVHRLPASQPEVQASIEQLRFQTDTLRHGAARLEHRLPELGARARHHLQRLYAMLWEPLVSRLAERRVVVVPHGSLHYLPFEALHDGQRYEIERRELCRAPSAVVLLHCLAQPLQFDNALLVGHADPRLPHVHAEIDAVALRFAGARALLGEAARGDALRDTAADVVHIACHAQFRNDSPRFSALHLADGALTVHDVARLRLNCSLATLSACETGVSAVLPGDELIGLTCAFVSAGAARVLASLWTVQDEAAAAFMRHFYEQLRTRARPGPALRAAQLEMLKTHPHPYFWAAFALHGGW